METNFFTQVAGLQLQGDLILTIRTLPDGMVAVSAYLKNEQVANPGKHRITPFAVTVKAADLDHEFFDTLSKPLQEVSSIMESMAAINKQVEEAKAALVKSQKAKAGQQEDPKIKRFNEAMKKVDELDEGGKHRQALAALPDPAEFPDHADALEERKRELTDKFAPELF